MFMLNNKPLRLDSQFETNDGTQYPASWLRMASPEERASIGITEIPDPDSFDARFYDAPGLPKDLAALKEEFTLTLNNGAFNILSKSDWLVIRAQEGVPVPEAWTTFRSAVRTTCNAAKDAIAASTSVEQLADVVNSVVWPEQPQ
jgi:hypothetical protein